MFAEIWLPLVKTFILIHFIDRISPETNHPVYHILSYWDTPNVGNPQPNCGLLFGSGLCCSGHQGQHVPGVPGVGMTDIATLNMAIEIVDFPMGGSFHSYVRLLEGNVRKAILNHH